MGQSIRCPDCSRDEEQITAGRPVESCLLGSRKASQEKACCDKPFNFDVSAAVKLATYSDHDDISSAAYADNHRGR